MWLLLFVAVPLLDLFILVNLASVMGLVPTIALVVLTGIGGWHLLKRQGLGIWRSAGEKMAQGEVPADELMEGVALVEAGALLITPGVITDLAGILLLIPPVRRLVVRIVKARLAPHVHVLGPDGAVHPDGPRTPHNTRIIDGEWEE